jgi:hypothetical protein
MARRLLAYIGPIIVLVGIAVAALGAWYATTARPEPGDVIDTFTLDTKRTLIVRGERGGARSFLELREGDTVKWQALIPHYAGAKGRPAIAWSSHAVTVRIERGGRAEVFAFALAGTRSGAKLGGARLAKEHEPVRMHAQGPITLTDHLRSFEIVAGAGWAQIVAIDLGSGELAWKKDLGPGPVTAGGVDGEIVWIEAGGRRRGFLTANGRDTPAP